MVLVVCLLLVPCVMSYDLPLNPTGYTNEYYQGYRYTGSRIAEHGKYENMTTVLWSQSASQDTNGTIWLVDKSSHIVISMSPETKYIPWHSFSSIVAGRKGQSGYYDGSFSEALFDSPMGLAIGKLGVYVADTRNHCIRFLPFFVLGEEEKNNKSLASRRTKTLAGHPTKQGMVDGAAQKAQFSFPISIGISQDEETETETETIFIVDNENRIRMLRHHMVTTLTDGACRTFNVWYIAQTIVMRDVKCQMGWDILLTASEQDIFKFEQFCAGHASTCGPRNHPSKKDTLSKYIQLK